MFFYFKLDLFWKKFKFVFISEDKVFSVMEKMKDEDIVEVFLVIFDCKYIEEDVLFLLLIFLFLILFLLECSNFLLMFLK